MIKTILNEPICNCVLEIQNRYTQIRNNAMETDQNNQPEKHWFSVDYKNYEKACNENGAIYLNELLMIEHNCTQNETIKQFLEHDRMYWNVQFTTLGSNAVSDIEKSIEKYDEQRIRCLDELKKATSGLNEIPDADYWIYFNSLQHLQLNRELLEHFKNKTPQQNEKPKPEQETIRYTAKHYVLAYLIECNAKGESFPVGQKKELEKIGNRIMGAGKGNRFYKVFNEIVSKDLNSENNLIEIGGENWRTIVKDLSNEPETIETYLQNKQL